MIVAALASIFLGAVAVLTVASIVGWVLKLRLAPEEPALQLALAEVTGREPARWRRHHG